MNDVQAAPLILAVGSAYDPRREGRTFSGPSEELLSISARLKDGLDGLSAWVQLHPILHRIDSESLRTAAKELDYLSRLFQIAHLELTGYCRQIPEPSDVLIALDIQKGLEKCFLTDIASETNGEIGGAFTSWGALVLSQKEIVWTPSMIQQLFKQVSSASWRKVRAILSDALTKLP